jgi:DNA mismatch repair protein MutS
MTPHRQQYLQMKNQYPGTIVMFHPSDFYEVFDDDAKVVASVCNIVLTGRDMGTRRRVLLACVPCHALTPNPHVKVVYWGG